jgi:flagellar biosynthesis anti-sigma factor FlgM
VQVLAAQVDNFPEIRQEKVAALEDAIQKGTYQVTPEKTAEAMLSQVRIVRIAA